MFKTLLLYLFATCISAAAFSQTAKGLSDDEESGKATAGETWAVIVGVSSYQNITKLNFADKDAKAFYDYLVDPQVGSKSSNIKLLLNGQAKAADLWCT